MNVLGRIPLTARVGLALILFPLASLAVWAGWYGSRSSERVACPEGTYSCDATSLVGAPWSISSGERIFASRRGEPGDQVGSFQCHKGHYVLNLDVVEDHSRLNFYQPHLVIYEAGGQSLSSEGPGDLSLLALVFCGPLGALITILAAIRSGQEKRVAFWKTYSLTQPGPAPIRFLPAAGKTVALLHRIRPPVQRPFTRLTQNSLILLLTLLMVWICWVVGISLALYVPAGLPIHVLRPGVTAARSPGLQPLLIRVAQEPGRPTREPVSRFRTRTLGRSRGETTPRTQPPPAQLAGLRRRRSRSGMEAGGRSH